MAKPHLKLLDICLSDYFQGCSADRGFVAAVPLHHKITLSEVGSLVIEDFRSIMGEERFTDDEVVDAVDEWLVDLAVRNDGAPSELVFWRADASEVNEDDELTEDAETVYAYILVTRED